MRRRLLVSFAAVLAACTSYDVLPLCQEIVRAARPRITCSTSDEFRDYERLLAWEVLRRSQWRFPQNVPLHVRVGAQRTVERVCVGSTGREASWNVRDRVAGSLRFLYRVPAGPECVAGTTIDLSGALASMSLSDGVANLPVGLTGCTEDLRDSRTRCPRQLEAVCGVFTDGRRRTYSNACDACKAGAVGYLDFECRTTY